MDPAAVVTRAGGAVRRSELWIAGISWRRIARAVRDGHLIDLGGGALAVAGARADVVAAVTRSASLSCVSALSYRDVELWRPPLRHHLSGPTRRTGRGVAWHRGPRDGLVVELPRAAAQALCCLPELDGLVAVDSLLRSDRCTIAAIQAELSRTAPGHARRVLSEASPLAGSKLESAMRHHLLRAGLPRPVLQAPIDGVGRVDFLLSGWLIVETDGWDTHGDRTSFEVDRGRDAAAAAQGFRTLRFTWDAIRYSSARVAAVVGTVLAAGPSTGSTVTDQDALGLM